MTTQRMRIPLIGKATIRYVSEDCTPYLEQKAFTIWEDRTEDRPAWRMSFCFARVTDEWIESRARQAGRPCAVRIWLGHAAARVARLVIALGRLVLFRKRFSPNAIDLAIQRLYRAIAGDEFNAEAFREECAFFDDHGELAMIHIGSAEFDFTLDRDTERVALGELSEECTIAADSARCVTFFFPMELSVFDTLFESVTIEFETEEEAKAMYAFLQGRPRA